LLRPERNHSDETCGPRPHIAPHCGRYQLQRKDSPRSAPHCPRPGQDVFAMALRGGYQQERPPPVRGRRSGIADDRPAGTTPFSGASPARPRPVMREQHDGPGSARHCTEGVTAPPASGSRRRSARWGKRRPSLVTRWMNVRAGRGYSSRVTLVRPGPKVLDDGSRRSRGRTSRLPPAAGMLRPVRSKPLPSRTFKHAVDVGRSCRCRRPAWRRCRRSLRFAV